MRQTDLKVYLLVASLIDDWSTSQLSVKNDVGEVPQHVDVKINVFFQSYGKIVSVKTR